MKIIKEDINSKIKDLESINLDNWQNIINESVGKHNDKNKIKKKNKMEKTLEKLIKEKH